MTLRTKSRGRQWAAWAAAAFFALAAYVILSRLVCGSVGFDLLDPARYRLALAIAVVFALTAWEMRWDGGSESEEVRVESEEVDVGDGECFDEGVGEDEAQRTGEDEAQRTGKCQGERRNLSSASSTLPGEALYVRARAMPHQEIPDFKIDGLYLDLLGESADAGYAPAMAKLGDYAMRRCAWVEAYYWMWRAQRGGLPNLEGVLRGIRRRWITAGCPAEGENVSDLFDEERGSVGRALLGIAAGRDASAASEYLRGHFPQYLESSDNSPATPFGL